MSKHVYDYLEGGFRIFSLYNINADGSCECGDADCTKTTMRIEQGDRIAQLLIVPVSMLQCVEVGSLDDTGRGACGFGSTCK